MNPQEKMNEFCKELLYLIKRAEEREAIHVLIAQVLPNLDWKSAYLPSATLTIKREDLPKLRKAFGKLRIHGRIAVSESKVLVIVVCEKLPSDIWFRYEMEYKARETSRCHIEKVEEKRESWALVCK